MSTSADDLPNGAKTLITTRIGGEQFRATFKNDIRGARRGRLICELRNMLITPDVPAIDMNGVPWLLRICRRVQDWDAADDIGITSLVGGQIVYDEGEEPWFPGMFTIKDFRHDGLGIHDHETRFAPENLLSFNDLCVELTQFLMRFSDLQQTQTGAGQPAIVELNHVLNRDDVIRLGRTIGGNLYFQGTKHFYTDGVGHSPAAPNPSRTRVPG